MEFGSRRAHGYDGAVLGARAAYVGGCIGTSCTVVEQIFGIPAMGTMAHSWVQMFDSELDAFRRYAQVYPSNCTLLVDTYNVLKSGIPNAIKVFKEEVVARGYRPKGIRIDSGDITYLSKEARKMLDEAGFSDCNIVASNSLDEYIIRDIIIQGAKVDVFGVGERLITSKSEPVFGGVYKLSAILKNGVWEPKMKLSENIGKTTIPGFKQVWRLFDRNSGKALSDVITEHDEIVDDTQTYTIFDPEQTWKQKTIENFKAEPLLVPIFTKGECVYESPVLRDIRAYCAAQISTLWEEALRFENPHAYYVDLSQKLWDSRDRLRKSMRNG
jgi:nicotinate phosphoribosyltransferase